MTGMLIWLIEWSLVGFLLGVLVFSIGGLLLAPFVSIETANKIAHYYSKIAQKIIGRSGLMEHGSKFELLSGTHESGKNADRFKVGDDIIHVTNQSGLRSTLYKQPFGLIPPPDDDRAEYVSPELAELGEKEAEREEKGTIENDGNYVEEVTLPPKRPLVQIRDYAARMIPGTRKMWDLYETEEIYKFSQSLFSDTKVMDLMVFIIAYSVASLLTWIFLTNGGGTIPETTINVPGMGMLLPVIP